MTMMHIIRVVGVTFRSKHSPSRFTTFSNNLNVFTKVNNSGVVCGSVIVKWRGKSYSAASASASELPKPKPKPPKRRRVPRDVRRAMVESYVNKYRATHAGKFPTVYDVTKEVGGSHYVNRSIFQELVYNSKISTSNKKSENLLGEELLKENESFIEVEKVPTKEMNMDAGIHGDYKVVVNNVEIGDTSNKHLKEERRKKASPGVEKMLSEEVGQPTIPGSSSDFVAAQSDLLERDVEDLSYPSLEISKGGELKKLIGEKERLRKLIIHSSKMQKLRRKNKQHLKFHWILMLQSIKMSSMKGPMRRKNMAQAYLVSRLMTKNLQRNLLCGKI
ncbi:hypothetical protein CFOL_v3_06069 [Cephalotus follicularis]|uniref:AT3G52170-like helix-turn-helix domain-containing protein n=1 Tax=Cephalotus follicularis TaxID=3775 RepID=A0A1Q3B3E2_CEPFO|nr:hypothetical protein CFOL_v3_06069 [Cephalotus follicularis]